MNKSILKTKIPSECTNVKKVTFNDVVRLFIEEKHSNSEFHQFQKKDLKCVEISIVDKSNYDSCSDSFEEGKDLDFQVHKVVYDNYILPDNCDEPDIQSEISESGSVIFASDLEENLEFLVHKVTDNEDKLTNKFFFENGCNEDVLSERIASEKNLDINEDNEEDRISKLSVENILEHDKIIAFIDQSSLCLSSLSFDSSPKPANSKSCSSNPKILNGLVLSPPLQELSLDKIVEARKVNALCELDISPLNSVQETDSDSEASSEGTMIMMTSEESQRNEQHIKQSLEKFLLMKKESTASENLYNSSLKYDCSLEEFEHEESLCNEGGSDNCNLYEKEPSTFESMSNPTNTVEDTYTLKEDDGLENEYSVHLLLDTKDNLSTPVAKSKHILHTLDKVPLINQTLTAVKIPNDVREWKILIGSLQNTTHDAQIYRGKNICLQDKAFSDSSSSSDSLGESSNSDELETFVQENTGRVERIRQRYSNKKINQSFGLSFGQFRSKPQFSSTAQILHLIKKQGQPPPYIISGTKNHMSWPCEEANKSNNIQGTLFYISRSPSSEYSSGSESLSSSYDDYLNCSEGQDWNFMHNTYRYAACDDHINSHASYHHHSKNENFLRTNVYPNYCTDSVSSCMLPVHETDIPHIDSGFDENYDDNHVNFSVKV